MSDFTSFVSNLIDIDTQIYQHWLNGIGVHEAVLKQYSRHNEPSSATPLASAPNLNAVSSDSCDMRPKGAPLMLSQPSVPPPITQVSTSTISSQSQKSLSTAATSASSSSTSLSTSSRRLSTEKSFFLPSMLTGVRRAMEMVDTWMTYPSFSLSLTTPTSATPMGHPKHMAATSSTGHPPCLVVDPSLNLHVITQYRWFTCIEPLLHRPSSLEHAIVFKLAPSTRQTLIDGYYTFDDTLMREIVGKKLTARLRRDLDEGSVPKITVASARRQFDNLKRILKKSEENELGVDGIEMYFKLSSNLVRNYTNILFLYRQKIDLHKRKLSYLTYADIDACTSMLRFFRPMTLPVLKLDDMDTSKLRFMKNLQSILSKESLKNIFLEIHEKLVELVFGLGWTVTDLDIFMQSLKQELPDLDVLDHLGNITLRMLKTFYATKGKKTASTSNEFTDSPLDNKLA